MADDTYVLIVRGAIGAMFLFSAIVKARSMADFKGTFRSLGIHGRSAAVLAYATVVVETLAAAGIIVGGAALLPALALSAFLMAAFAGTFARALRSGRVVRCNCFGSSPTLIGWHDVARNVLIAALILPAIVIVADQPNGGLSTDAWLPAVVTGFALVMAVANIRLFVVAARSDV